MTQVVPNLTLCQQRAQGMPGARCARSLVCEMKKHTSVVTTVTPESPGIPRAMVLTAYSALSPVTGLVCHRRLRKGSRKLDASVGASGPHDFAVRIRRASSLRTISVHRIPPHVRDDRETPLERSGIRIDIFLFLPRRQVIFRKIRNGPTSSSPRTRGPIRRGLADLAQWLTASAQQTTVVMGPCVRRDDGESSPRQ